MFDPEPILKYPTVFLVAVAAAMFLTLLWLRLARRFGFMDHPGGRKLHPAPVPVGGGLAIALGFHVACALVFLFPWAPFSGQISIQWWFRFIPLTAGVLLLGLIDDRFGMRPMIKLSGQGLLALAAYALGIRLQNVLGIALPEWINLAGTVLWFLVMMNAFNLIDGMDGLASGIGMLAAIGMAVSLVLRKSPGDVLLLLALAGACLGFLRYNFYPARVFLGDTGSQFIGLTLAALAISTSSKGPAVAVIGMPLLAIGIPLFDTVLAIWRRTVRQLADPGAAGGTWLTAFRHGDAEHLHHRLLRSGRSHSEVAGFLYGGTVLLAATGVAVSVYNDRAIGLLALGVVALSCTVFRHLAWIELQDSGKAVLRGINRPVRRNRTLLYYLCFDLVALHVAWLAAVVLLDALDGIHDAVLKSIWLKSVSIDIVIPFLLLVFSRSYSRVWYLARVAEYAKTGLALLAGIGMAFALRQLLHPGAGPVMAQVGLHYTVMAAIAVPLIVGIRAALRIVQDLVQLPRHSAFHARGGGVERVAVWGSSYQTALFLAHATFNMDRTPALQVVGIFSCDDAVRSHYVHGIRVVGGLQELHVFIREGLLDAVYLVADLSPADSALLLQLAQSMAVRIIRWQIVEDVRHA